MRISDWSSDVCSSDLIIGHELIRVFRRAFVVEWIMGHGKRHRIQDQQRLFCILASFQRIAFRLLGHPKFLTREPAWIRCDYDRKSVVSGKAVSVRVDVGGCRTTTKQTQNTNSF